MLLPSVPGQIYGRYTECIPIMLPRCGTEEMEAARLGRLYALLSIVNGAGGVDDRVK